MYDDFDFVKLTGHHGVRRLSDGKLFPLVLHNGLKSEVTDEYIRAMVAAFPELDADYLLGKTKKPKGTQAA